MSNMRPTVVSVVLDQNLTKPLDYAIQEELQDIIKVGMRVAVPFRTTIKNATVVEVKTSSSYKELKWVIGTLGDTPYLTKTQWSLAEWMSEYYAAPMQKTLRCFIPPNVRSEKASKQQFRLVLKLGKEKALQWIIENRNTAAALILEKLLASQKGYTASELMKECGCSRSSIQTLLKKKWIEKEEEIEFDLSEEDFFPSSPKVLNVEQKECLAKIEASLAARTYTTHLIHGVTGSGKTEIYFQAIQKALELNLSTIFLVPEIALTSQTIERFRARFQEKIAIWHSQRSKKERSNAWQSLKQGKAKIVIGARSAIFCPLQNVGLIIVDEEHDQSYKQAEEMPCYHARDVAVMRGFFEKTTVVLGSATPSIESRYNAQIGKYTFSLLQTRATSAPMPKIQIVDMKQEFEKAGGFTHFSSLLIDAMKERFERGEQTLLLLNQRGYHRSQICVNCRTTIQCPHCDIKLSFHKSNHLLRCHLCDFTQEAPLLCPSCGARDTLQFKGFGTEHVQKALHAILPSIRTIRMDRDTTRKKNEAEEMYKQFKAHKADVLVGTQMIAKGFHFPSVTLVAVLSADTSLSIPDFRSAESLFQLLTQVAGRSGRSELAGEVIFQTFLPDHPLLQLVKEGDYESFYAQELKERKLFNYPPFCRLVKITSFGTDREKTREENSSLHSQIEQANISGITIFAVTAPAHEKIKDQYRFQFLIKVQKIRFLTKIFKSLYSKLHFRIDIDTINTFF